ncbi:hypothetical protein ACJVC5_10070 [Peredibacter sp. HCB2-198]|uniref:hypothetical protein n=1 Tax=Peredibacter sp. HCB2-198 TaxID=3383025 RepID=UPI0038B664B8
MSRIFSFLLSFQLLVAPINVAYAESQSKTETTQKPAPAKTTAEKKAEEKAAAKDSIAKGVTDAESSQTNPQYDSESQHQGGFGFYSKQVLAISTSIIGGSIIEQCALGAKIPSIITFMAGSLVYIASELSGAKEQNADHNRRIEDIKVIEQQLKSQGGEVQRAMLEQRLKEEKATRDYFIKKRNWMIAVTAIYFTAMALALSEEASGIAAGVASGTMVCAGLAAAYAAGCGPKYPACYAAHFAACQALAPLGWAAVMPNFANPAAPAVSLTACAAATQYAPGCAAYHMSYHAIAYAGCQPIPGVSGMIIAKAISMAYSTALTRTSGAKSTSYIVMLAGLLMFFVPSLQSMVVAMYNYPIPRSITFGISAALATAVTTGYMSRISVAEENIKKLETLLAHYRKQTDDDTTIGADLAKNPDQPTTNGTEFQGVEVNPTKVNYSNNNASTLKPNEIRKLTTDNKPIKLNRPKTCISNSGGSVDFSEKACATPLKVSRPTFTVKNNNGDLIKNAGNLTIDMAQAVSDGDIDKADAIAGQLGSMASKIKETALNYQKEKNEILKAAGIKSEESGELLDYQKQLNDQVAAIQMDLVKEAQKHKLNISAADLNLEDGAASVSDKTKAEELKIGTVASTNIEAIKNDITPGTEESGMGMPDEKSLLGDYKEDTSGAGLPTGISEEGMDSLFSKQNSGEITEDNPYGLSPEALRAARANGYAQLENRVKRYGIEEDGINSLSDSSIFKQISTRYFMNYSKISIRRQKSASP